MKEIATGVDLVALSIRINSEAVRVERAVEQFTERALSVGEMLLTAKHAIGHGNWIGWVETELEIGTRQAQRYMQAATNKDAVLALKSDPESYLPGLKPALEALKESQSKPESQPEPTPEPEPEPIKGGRIISGKDEPARRPPDCDSRLFISESLNTFVRQIIDPIEAEKYSEHSLIKPELLQAQTQLNKLITGLNDRQASAIVSILSHINQERTS